MRIAQLGKYKIVEKLGQGAMGEVWRASDPVLGRDVAIKITAGKLSGDEVARQRFLREARAAAQLKHENIVTVYDFGEEQGVAYMVMELLEGTDLRAMIDKSQIQNLEDKLYIMEQILDGLAFAHAKALVHRDIKPANIHVLPNGKVKIMDFGLARHEEDAAATSAVMGTPYYMAPETAQGQGATTRTDVFSLGAVFYELLSGKRPFTGASIPAVLLAVATKDPEPLAQVAPQVPAALGPFLGRALAKNPDGRYADAAEMLDALRIVEAGGELPEASVHPAFATQDETPARELGPALSARPGTSEDLRIALDEIDQYLIDHVPPLMASDAVSQLTTVPLEDAAAELWAWAERQQLVQVLDPMVDLLFHALHKLSMLGELALVEKNGLIAYLRGVGLELAAALPPGDRDRLRRALRHLGEAEMVRTGPVELRKMTEPAAGPLPQGTPGLRRLSLMEQRLRRGLVGNTPAAKVAHRRVVSQAITLAANEARSEQELENHLRRLRSVGVASGAEHVFRSLGGELADWALPKAVSDTADLGPAHEVQAMKQIVSLPEDPVEVARRYRHLVSAAVEQFNAGNLGGAVQMFELATKLATDKKIDRGYTEPVLKRGHETLDPARTREYLERSDRHPQLQVVMAFFESGLGPASLLDELEKEERRDRRRLLLDLLSVHGDRARSVVLDRLLASLSKPASDFARRNWVYLLRVMPRPAGEVPEAEIDAVSRFATPENPGYLVKEALLHVSHLRHPHAAHALIALLEAWEERLEEGGLAGPELEEALGALDRIASGLARQGGRKAWIALVDHALSRRPKLGATLDRLAELGLQDLSGVPEVVTALSEAVRHAMPRGVLGRLMARRDHELPALVGALAGTRTPAARALLEEVARRFPTQEAGRAASRAMEAPAAPAPASISGELDPYVLPQLLHRVAEARSSGTLNLLPAEGAGLPATVGFLQGAIVAARWAQRRDLDAVYQLFERPFAGRYAFDPGATPPQVAALAELQAVLREGVRRARELRRTSAIVPDDAPLEATGTAPGTVLEEPEYDLVVTLWQRSCAGVTADALEAELAADAFRILRPIAQWVEEGALRPVLPEPAPAAASASAPGT